MTGNGFALSPTFAPVADGFGGGNAIAALPNGTMWLSSGNAGSGSDTTGALMSFLPGSGAPTLASIVYGGASDSTCKNTMQLAGLTNLCIPPYSIVGAP